MIEITEIFDTVLRQQQSLDVAESEFRRMLVDDENLRQTYRRWCAEQDTSEKRGFIDYCRQRIEEEESCWESLASHDDEY